MKGNNPECVRKGQWRSREARARGVCQEDFDPVVMSEP